MKANLQSIDPHEGTPSFLSYNDTPSIDAASSWIQQSAFFSASQEFSQRFPNFMGQEDFICNTAAHVTDAFQFAAMSIRLAPHCLGGQTPPPLSSHRLNRSLGHLAQAIDAISASHGGLWGTMAGNGTFGCIFPGENGHTCRMLSKKLKKGLPDNLADYVCIGIASYPTINFNRRQILPNAQKALEHALLMGAGATVILDAVSLNISGDKHYQAGDYDKAGKDFQLALKLDPFNVNIHNSLGVCYGMTGRPEKALEAFETAIWLDPQEVMAIHNAGITYQMMGDSDKAIALLEQASSIDDSIFETALHTGILLLKRDRPHQGATYLEQAVQLSPETAFAWRCLGDCYGKLDMSDKAVRAYKQAIKRNPEDAEALSALGYLYCLNHRNLEIAAVFCRQSTLLEPENGMFHQRLGQIYLAQNKKEEALKAFQRAQALGTNSEYWLQRIDKQSCNGLAYQ